MVIGNWGHVNALERMGAQMGGFFSGISTIFLSLVLGSIMLVFVSLQFPDAFASILDAAAWLETQIGNTGLENKYNNWVRFLIGDEQLTFMFFTILARIILSFLFAGIGALTRRGY